VSPSAHVNVSDFRNLDAALAYPPTPEDDQTMAPGINSVESAEL
jgi:hypothetical protein